MGLQGLVYLQDCTTSSQAPGYHDGRGRSEVYVAQGTDPRDLCTACQTERNNKSSRVTCGRMR